MSARFISAYLAYITPLLIIAQYLGMHVVRWQPKAKSGKALTAVL